MLLDSSINTQRGDTLQNRVQRLQCRTEVQDVSPRLRNAMKKGDESLAGVARKACDRNDACRGRYRIHGSRCIQGDRTDCDASGTSENK